MACVYLKKLKAISSRKYYTKNKVPIVETSVEKNFALSQNHISQIFPFIINNYNLKSTDEQMIPKL